MNGQPVRAVTLVRLLQGYEVQELAVALSQVIYIKAEGKSYLALFFSANISRQAIS